MSQPPLSASNDNLLYNLSYLSSVIHPVIILRLLEHRLFTPLFKKKSITTNVPTGQSPMTTTSPLNPLMGASAISCIPTLPPIIDSTKPKQNSQTSLERPIRKMTKDSTNSSLLITSMQNVGNLSSPTTNTNLSDTSEILTNSHPNPKDLSLLLNSTTSNATRKWFWRNPDKNCSPNGNPLLQTINENPPSTNGNCSTGVGEMKSFEKELLNLPTFQLSDSQNPLLPSPTSLNYEFSPSFEPSDRSFPHDDESKSFALIENRPVSTSHLSCLHVPFVSVRTPSTDESRPSSTRTSIVKKHWTKFFRSSKTLENLRDNERLRPHLSYSQPAVWKNLWTFNDENEKTPLINRPALNVPNENENLQRSLSCSEGIHPIEAPVVVSNCLQTTTSDVVSLRSSDSATSSLSAYLSAQPGLNLHSSQGNITKSQESLFSFSSPARKHRSFKSLFMAAATKEQVAKPGNDVLFLIASWVLRSPEDFQGNIELSRGNIRFFLLFRSNCSERIEKFLCSFGIIEKFISKLDESNQRNSWPSGKSMMIFTVG